MQIPMQIVDIAGDGYHALIQGGVNGKEARFLIDTGASRTVFDPAAITRFIETPSFSAKQGPSVGVGGSDLECSTFIIDTLSIGDIAIHNYEAVALDLSNVHETYKELGLPVIDGIIGGDLLVRLKATINYRLKKIRLTALK